ncbi:phosphatidylinositol-specific phospholipase C domain-containing protein [Streptomyces sp. NPDC054796]
MNRSRLVTTAAATALAATACALTVPQLAGAAPSAPTPTAKVSDSTAVGVHNAYEKDKYGYFADALDSGASLLELDVWTSAFGSGWRVAHNNPIGSDNNCENASSPDELRTKPRNQSLGGCLADMRAWHEAHPDHAPVTIKVEMKDGFYGKADRGPAQLDALLTEKLGDALYRPADLAGDHANLDEAVRAGAWPDRSALAGKFVFELIPGTVEEGNPADDLWTDREYATHLRDLAAAGRLGEAGAFPAVHGAEKGDPRESRYAEDLRGWFVFFDGDASAYAAGDIDTGWYRERGYLVVMTDAHKVAPEIDATNPTEQQARDRVTQLAGANASYVTSDWYPLPSVLSMVVPRGEG